MNESDQTQDSLKNNLTENNTIGQKLITQKAENFALNKTKDAPTDAENNRFYKLKNDNLETDINLKKKYAYWLIGVMILQLLVMNAVFVGVGLEKIKYSDYVLHLYISGTLLELFGLVLIITKYLFKN